MTTAELLDLKQDIEDAKTKASELNGQLTALKKQLKNDWDCNTIEEAETKLDEMEVSIQSIDTKIKNGLQKIDDEYNIAE